MLNFICINLLWLAGGLVTGLTSFGGNLFAIPLISFLWEPKDAILMGCIVGCGISLYLALAYFRNILWRECLLLIVSGFCGAPVGIYFLNNSNPGLILILAGTIILLFLAWELVKLRSARPQKTCPTICAIPFGFASGFFTAAISMGGPPVVLYAFLRHWGAKEAISTINFTALPVLATAIITQGINGLYTGVIVRQSLWGLLFSGLGVALSIPIIARINVAIFRRMLLVMLALSGIALLARGILE